MSAEREIKLFSIVPPGICAWSVCVLTDMTRDEIENEANGKNPTGISSPWRISANDTFASGEPNPSPCEREPDARLHYLLEC